MSDKRNRHPLTYWEDIMHRPKHPSQKPVMVIVDYPIVNEVERDFPWSGASHLAMLSDFATAGIQNRSLHP